MEKKALIEKINATITRIATLERLEVHYSNCLQIPTNAPGGKSFVFNATVEKQAERHRLYVIRTELHDLAVRHNDLIEALEGIDANKTIDIEYPVLNAMLLRSAQIRHEINAYLAQDYAARSVNMIHVNNCNLLLTKIYRFLDQ
ncbi:hypothetical protein BGZ97_005253 [Linnemannia gamsii]|jgi:hypothetical protein|uniref:Uncharacterized protein n=1 Tax=Linnemannia gamsii TaxID=64522 RepID=A0A9P6URE7_9FUNG|nr:hypothetical protein BGZ97_005253 [Linnemannia gamsii]